MTNCLFRLFLSVIILSTCGLQSCSSDPESELSEAEQLAKDIEIIDQFLADRKLSAFKDPSGLRYVIFTQGTGPKPTLSNSINFSQIGTLFDGTTIKNSAVANDAPITALMPGLKIGYQLINEGTKANFYIPSGLGFGKTGGNGVPPNSNLIYEVELKGVY